MENIGDFKLSLESLKKSLKVLNAKASEVEEQIKFPKDSGQKKRKRDIEEWLTRVKSVENEVVELRAQAESEGFIRNLMDGGKLVKLNEEVVILVEQSQHFDELCLDTCGTRGVELLTTKMVGKTFDENCKNIWNLLEMRKVSSIGIYGMGGVGKTALVKSINNLLLKQSQAHVIWITFSQEFTIRSLQDKIACFLGVNILDEDDVEIRAARLHRVISRMKNLVLIFDDLWQFIDLVKVGCCVSVECCRLIITTRSLEVCREMHCKKVVKVEKLCDDEAWKLFVGMLTSGEEIGLGPDAEEIAKSVARLCEGLPLGIINVAGRMRGKTSTLSCNTALSELTEPVTRQGSDWDVEVMRVLKYSFDRLNNQSRSKEFNLFQRCFLYCSLYTKICVGVRSDMAERFISEGLVDGRKTRRAQLHQGHLILDKLVDVCLLEDIVGYDGYVKMHYLVRRMALKISEQKYMAGVGVKSLKKIPIEKEWTKDLEKVSFVGSDICIIRDGISPNCPNLTTLLLNATPLRSISDSFFSKLKRLTNLDLSRTNIRVLPHSVSNLTSLESLFLEGCDQLKTVPYLGRLKALRELTLSDTAIEEVPEGVEGLFNLQLLSLDTTTLKELPSGLLYELGHLQSVKFPIKVEIPPEELCDLKEVEELHGRLNNVRVFNDFVTRNPEREALYQVQIGQYYPEDEEHTVRGSHDREAYLSQCNLRYEKVLGGNIQSIAFWDCEGMRSCLLDEFSQSNHPKSLEMLRILGCEGTAYIWRSSQELPFPFSTLERLELEALKDFKGLGPEGEVGASAVFSSLRSLRIGNCCSMKSVGLPVTGFPSLEDIHISECGELEKIFEDDGTRPVILPKLKELGLRDLPRLQSLCNATVLCDTIKWISVSGCPSLMKKLPLHVDIPQALQATIKVEREWWESLEWEDPTLPQLLQPLVHFF